ncbi:DUF1801 domain-containing protein [Paraglaciecola hydrolytica]|uniref:YdhG-like domain-containing protein n=1 Tax=Paraglaciecola hydrolytica TaxID=1799789 RepID=A0A148KL72_9ALTE|nr:DUF1801 domain-containing protein [Paraglaciecola hydrolytica]KXI27047.1 hypothetical protein AX660_01250 [Paraglaciecola hydrolytica]
MHNMPNEVTEVFAAYPLKVKQALLQIRQWIEHVASENLQIGELSECLKWGEPSYITLNGIGTTLRLGRVRDSDSKFALLVHCQTRLVADFKEVYPDCEYDKNRAFLLDSAQPLPEQIIKHFILLALTYHLKR